MPRRVSDKRVASFTAALGESEATKRRRLLIEALRTELGQASEDQLLSIQSILKGGPEVVPEVFARQVCFLGGPPPKVALPLVA